RSAVSAPRTPSRSSTATSWACASLLPPNRSMGSCAKAASSFPNPTNQRVGSKWRALASARKFRSTTPSRASSPRSGPASTVWGRRERSSAARSWPRPISMRKRITERARLKAEARAAEMGLHLLLTVHLHGDGQGSARYHGMYQGAPEWPPAPARVFQALVAGVARGNLLPESVIPAFEWLERLDPPLIGAPVRTLGQRFSMFVPNNDTDSLNNPLDVSGLRVKKVVQPSLFSEVTTLLYVWSLPENPAPANTIVEAAN